jgi:hypothetical protein
VLDGRQDVVDDGGDHARRERAMGYEPVVKEGRSEQVDGQFQVGAWRDLLTTARRLQELQEPPSRRWVRSACRLAAPDHAPRHR